jgi:signal transduction histidine kinase
MNPRDMSSAASSGATPHYQVSEFALNALRNPLTAILGRSQLLQRRILQGAHLSPKDSLAALATIERSVWELEQQLRELQDEANRRP